MQGQLQMEVLHKISRKHYSRLTPFSQYYHLKMLFLMFSCADTGQLKDQLNVGDFFLTCWNWVALVNIIMSEWQESIPLRSSGKSPVAWLLQVKCISCKGMEQTFVNGFFFSEILLSTASLSVRIFVWGWDCYKVRQKTLKAGFILK